MPKRVQGSRESSVNAHIGARLRLRRTLLGMSQSALGDALGVSFQQVQKYERGTNGLSPAGLLALAEALDVPLSFFLDGLQPGTQAPDDLDPRRSDLELMKVMRRVPAPIAAQLHQLARSIATAA